MCARTRTPVRSCHVNSAHTHTRELLYWSGTKQVCPLIVLGGVPYKIRYVYSYNTGLQRQSVYYSKADLKEEQGVVLLDPNQLSADGTVGACLRVVPAIWCSCTATLDDVQGPTLYCLLKLLKQRSY